MDIASFSLDIFKYILAGCAVAGVANWMFWTKYNSHVFRLKTWEAGHAAKKDVLPLRLQAYERLVLLIERINPANAALRLRSEEHTSELQSRENLVCRLLLEKKENNILS